MLATFGVAAAQTTIGDLTYRRTGPEERKEVFVSAKDNTISGDIIVPSTVEIDGTTYTVTTLGGFNGCSKLNSIVIPETVTTIYAQAFYESGITSIKLSENLAYIEMMTFYGCKNLQSITIPSSVAYINSRAFAGCKSLTSVTIPENVTALGSHIFMDCDNLESVSLPSKIKLISMYTFSGCKSLTEITIPASVNAIRQFAFSGCENLSQLYSLNPTPPEVEEDTFNGIAAETTLYVPKGSVDAYTGATGWSAAFTDIREIPDVFDYLSFTVTSEENREVSVKAKDKQISGKIVIPATVEIEEQEYTVTSIGQYAFHGCKNVTSVIMPETIKAIEDWSFYDCNSLSSLTIPKEVASIGSQVFIYCYALKEFSVDDENPYFASYDKSLYNKDLSVLLQVPVAYDSEKYIIPETVTEIGTCAFLYCQSLTEIEIPESVTVIGDQAFQFCNKLSSVNLPEGISTIGWNTFANCNALSSIRIPESVTTIDRGAFGNCAALTSIIIPKSVNTIGNAAFSGCKRLSKVYCLNPVVPTASNSSFNSISSDAVLYVPSGSVEEYASATGWSTFTDIREIDKATLTVNVMSDDAPVSGATVTVLDREFTTDENGIATISDLDADVLGTIVSVSVSKDGYENFEGTADFTATLDVAMTVTLVKLQNGISHISNDIDLSDSKVYDLNGRRVLKPQSGRIYIINGQKVLLQ